jgi:hypothetical protein
MCAMGGSVMFFLSSLVVRVGRWVLPVGCEKDCGEKNVGPWPPCKTPLFSTSQAAGKAWRETHVSSFTRPRSTPTPV